MNQNQTNPPAAPIKAETICVFLTKMDKACDAGIFTDKESMMIVNAMALLNSIVRKQPPMTKEIQKSFKEDFTVTEFLQFTANPPVVSG